MGSYSRGMRLLTECGGAKTPVVEEAMQRSPVFIFDDALEGPRLRPLGARTISRRSRPPPKRRRGSAKPRTINQFAVGPLRHLQVQLHDRRRRRAEYAGKATFAACEWIKDNYPGGARYILAGNMDIATKHSRTNMLIYPRPARLPEATIKKDDAEEASCG